VSRLGSAACVRRASEALEDALGNVIHDTAAASVARNETIRRAVGLVGSFEIGSAARAAVVAHARSAATSAELFLGRDEGLSHMDGWSARLILEKNRRRVD
jgi:hypothetical protein